MHLLLIILGSLLRLVSSGLATVRPGVIWLRLREVSFSRQADFGRPGYPFAGWLYVWPLFGAFWKTLDCNDYFPTADCRGGVGGLVPVTQSNRPPALDHRKPVAIRRF